MIQTPTGIDVPQTEAAASASPELWAAARQFEALLLQMVMKVMRDTVEETDLFGNGPELGLYRQLHDEALAEQSAGGVDMGLARAIVHQLTGSNEPRDALHAVAAVPEATGQARVLEALRRAEMLGLAGQERER